MGSKNKVSAKFLKMAEIYKIFAKPFEHMLDYTDEALLEMYLYESTGKGFPSELNAYFVGKRWLNVTVAMWKKDIKDGIISFQELRNDPKFPHWWLESVL